MNDGPNIACIAALIGDDALGWARRIKGSRVIAFTLAGERAYRAAFDAPHDARART